MTNIIILLAQTDLMSTDQVAASKSQIHCQLKEADIRLFSFSMPSHFPASDPDRQGIYAISSATGSDHDTMDASLLMSPDYVQPLIPTELATLVSHVFTSNGVSWLRHSVARKYVQWRKSSFPSPSTTPLSSPRPQQQQQPPSLPRSQTLPASLAPSSSSSSFFFPNHPSSLSATTTQNQLPPLPPPPHLVPSSTPNAAATATSNYALARLADHAQREERLAQVRLANWAADLQRSLARERAQYAALARAERAAWLAARIGECVRDGSLVVAQPPPPSPRGRSGSRSRSRFDLGLGEGVHFEGFEGFGQVLLGGELEVNGEGLGNGSGSGSGSGRTRGQRRRGCYDRQGRGEKSQGQSQSQSQSQHQRHRQDPLGLLEVAAELRHKGLIALEVLGSLGVLGGLALWVTRHYLHLQPCGWVAGEWERFWYGSR